jgi:hypothetical protein
LVGRSAEFVIDVYAVSAGATIGSLAVVASVSTCLVGIAPTRQAIGRRADIANAKFILVADARNAIPVY